MARSNDATDGDGARESLPGYLFVLPWGLEHAGGVNEVVRNLYAKLVEGKEFAPHILVVSWPHKNLQTGLTAGLPCFFLRVPYVWGERPLQIIPRFLLNLPATMRHLLRVLRDARISVINVHYPGIWAFVFVLAKLTLLYRGKLTFSFHGTDAMLLARARGTAKHIWSVMFRVCDAVTACSDDLRRRIVASIPDTSKKSFTLHNGIDPERLSAELAVAMSLPENLRGMRFILNVGTYDSNKGQHLLLRAFAQIAHEHSDLLLVFAGRPGPALSDLRALASELRMEERVSFLQGLPHCDVLVLFQNAILFALTSQREGFPLVLLEAGFLCVPVIATAVGGVPEAIRNEEEGMLIQSEDQPALEHALRRLLSDERMRENLARNLRKRVLTSFTWEYAYRRLLEITHGSFPQAAAD